MAIDFAPFLWAALAYAAFGRFSVPNSNHFWVQSDWTFLSYRLFGTFAMGWPGQVP